MHQRVTNLPQGSSKNFGAVEQVTCGHMDWPTLQVLQVLTGSFVANRGRGQEKEDHILGPKTTFCGAMFLQCQAAQTGTAQLCGVRTNGVLLQMVTPGIATMHSAKNDLKVSGACMGSKQIQPISGLMSEIFF